MLNSNVNKIHISHATNTHKTVPCELSYWRNREHAVDFIFRCGMFVCLTTLQHGTYSHIIADVRLYSISWMQKFDFFIRPHLIARLANSTASCVVCILHRHVHNSCPLLFCHSLLAYLCVRWRRAALISEFFLKLALRLYIGKLWH